MKVALVCPYDWSKPGGVKAHVANLAEYLLERHEVRIYAPASAPLRGKGLDRHVHAVGRPVPIRYNESVAPVGLNPRVIWRMKHLLNEYNPHVTHIHEPLAPWVSMAATVAGPMPKVGTFHAWSSTDRIYRAMSPFIRRACARWIAMAGSSPSASSASNSSMARSASPAFRASWASTRAGGSTRSTGRDREEVPGALEQASSNIHMSTPYQVPGDRAARSSIRESREPAAW